jgi:hypothetical protein
MAIKANAKNLDFIKANLQKNFLSLQHEARHPELDTTTLSVASVWSQLLDLPLIGKNQAPYGYFFDECSLLGSFMKELPVVRTKASNSGVLLGGSMVCAWERLTYALVPTSGLLSLVIPTQGPSTMFINYVSGRSLQCVFALGLRPKIGFL